MIEIFNCYNDHKINNYYLFKKNLLNIYYQKWNSTIINNILHIYNNQEFKDFIFNIFKEHPDFKKYILNN
jgi:AAA+ superfamily predicted ATPase